MMNSVAMQVREAFEAQAQLCGKLGSGFMELLCKVSGQRLSHATSVGSTVLTWRGEPSERGDALPLRFASGLHKLVLKGLSTDLAALYASNSLPDGERLWMIVESMLREHEYELLQSLKLAPQTNEVGRAAILMCGLLYIAEQTRLPLCLYEIGASAGLNLIPDLYRYRFGDSVCGKTDSQLLIAPTWTGRQPEIHAPLNIVERYGSDISPIDLKSEDDCLRLLSYVWPDQLERIARLRLAIETGRNEIPEIVTADAADWVDRRFAAAGEDRTTRVLMHSIVWNYLSAESRKKISQRIEQCARGATASKPFAWLRFELEEQNSDPVLRLSLWPYFDDRVLASAQPHGRAIKYLV
jgi:hypothetical protein